MGILRESAQTALASARAYADTERSHLGTARVCAAAGVDFVPMVAESTGAWEPGAAAVLWQLARAASLVDGRPAPVVHAEFAQRLPVVVRRAQARALVRRVGEA